MEKVKCCGDTLNPVNVKCVGGVPPEFLTNLSLFRTISEGAGINPVRENRMFVVFV